MATHREPEITVAAYLWVKGFHFTGCVEDAKRRSRLLFEFEDRDGQAAQVRMEFLNGGHVAAKQYAAALSDLKSQLYTAKEGYGNGKRSQSR